MVVGKLQEHSVVFGKPNIAVLRDDGWDVVDMHFHSNYSDSFSSIKRILKLADKKDIGVAIMDHNLIAGVEKAYELKGEQLIIPGLEISSIDGPHILVYFYNLNDLRDYWTANVKPYLFKCPWLYINRTVGDIMNSLEDENCVVSAAHPMGYLMEYRGIQQGFEKGLISEDTVKMFDAYEVIGGTMLRSQNIKCKHAADRFGLGYTGGTDGHFIGEFGGIVTCSKSQGVDGFLDNVKNGKSSVYGHEDYFYQKFLHAFESLASFTRYLPSSVAMKVKGLIGNH